MLHRVACEGTLTYHDDTELVVAVDRRELLRPLVFQVLVRRGVDHLEDVLGVEDFTLLLLVDELLLILHQLEHHVAGVPVAVFIRARELVRCPHHHAGLGRVLGPGRILLAE